MTETASIGARARFAADLANLDVVLPVQIAPDCQASIIDAAGRAVLTVDVNRERPDAEACKIALWAVLAINTCGGFVLGGGDRKL